MRAPLVMALALIAPALTAAPARGDAFDPRVMVLPVEGTAPTGLGALANDVGTALATGAKVTSSSVARATASFEDTAVIVGCEAAEPDCADAVAAALNVDQLLLATITATGFEASIEITAITREAEPVTETYPVRKASRAADLALIQAAVPRMLEEGEARRTKALEPVDPDPLPPPDPDPVPAPRPPAEGAPSRLPLAVTIGGGVVLVAGVISWALASGLQGDIDDAPTSTPEEVDALVALEDRAALRATLGNVLVIAGAVVAVAGGTWWWLDHRSHARVTVSQLPGGAGVAIGGAW